MDIFEISEQPDLMDEAIFFFWECWGSERNFEFYKDCILHSLNKANRLPKFYIGLNQDKIIGTYALLTNDLISRQDLMPWLACLFVIESERNQGYAEKLLLHGIHQANAKGFDKLYLSTDLNNFYERKGWTYLCNGFGVSGGMDKIYSISTL
jgi:GNAT superfamily N-acetyltransferase